MNDNKARGVVAIPYRVNLDGVGDWQHLLTGSRLNLGGDRSKLRDSSPRVGWVQLVTLKGSFDVGTGNADHGARVAATAGQLWPPVGLPPMRLDQRLHLICTGLPAVGTPYVDAVVWVPCDEEGDQ